MTEKATSNLKNKGYKNQVTTMQDGHDVEEQIEKRRPIKMITCRTCSAENRFRPIMEQFLYSLSG